MAYKKWVVASADREAAKELAHICDTDPFITLITMGRGIIAPEELEEFLGEDSILPDPFSFAGMDAAAERIDRALMQGEKITVFGDYDCDGVTATAILCRYLREKGADFSYYIPLREGEGYGMSLEAVEKIARDGTKLIITVDNGIRCAEEIKRARELGVDTVVTDHHIPGDVLPRDAVAIVDPHLDHCPSGETGLCGAGVALMLVAAVEGVSAEETAARYGALAALGTVADVMPLVGTNRSIVREGLRSIGYGECPQISILFAEAGGKSPLTAESLAFIVAPRINAAGRMGNAAEALNLFLSDSREEMQSISEKLCGLNNQRREREHKILDEALSKVEKEGYCHDRVIVVSGEGWHPGVIGIVASSICERYGKPAIVLCKEDGILSGSGRSIEGYDLIAALTKCEDLFIKYGGHAGAAGLTLSVEKEEEFRRRINSAEEEIPVSTVYIDCKLNPAAVNLDLVEKLSLLEPMGNGNPNPLFGLYGMEIAGIDFVGDGKHSRLTLHKNGVSLTAMMFSVGAKDMAYRVGDRVDVAVNLSINYYKDIPKLSIKISHIRPEGSRGELLTEGMQKYGDYIRGRLPLDEIELMMPNREEIGEVWRIVRQREGLTAHSLIPHLKKDAHKAMIALDVMLELGLIKNEDGRLYIVEGAKADLSRSRILNR